MALFRMNALGLRAIQGELDRQVTTLNQQVAQTFTALINTLDTLITTAQGEYKQKLIEYKAEVQRIEEEYNAALKVYEQEKQAYQSALNAYTAAMSSWSSQDPKTRGAQPTLSATEPTPPKKQELPPVPVYEDGGLSVTLAQLQQEQNANLQCIAEISAMVSGIGELIIQAANSDECAYYSLRTYTFQDLVAGVSTQSIDIFSNAIVDTKQRLWEAGGTSSGTYVNSRGEVMDIRVDIRVDNAFEKITGSDGAVVYLESLLPADYKEEWFTKRYQTRDGEADTMFKHNLSIMRGTPEWDAWVDLAGQTDNATTFVNLAIGLGLSESAVRNMLTDAGKPDGLSNYVASMVANATKTEDSRKQAVGDLTVIDTMLNRMRTKDYLSTGLYQKDTGDVDQCFVYCLLNSLGAAADMQYDVSQGYTSGGWIQTLTAEDGTVYQTGITDLRGSFVPSMGLGTPVDEVSDEVNNAITQSILNGQDVCIQIGYSKLGGGDYSAPHWVLISDWTGDLSTSTFFDPYNESGLAAEMTLDELGYKYGTGNGASVGLIREISLTSTENS